MRGCFYVLVSLAGAMMATAITLTKFTGADTRHSDGVVGYWMMGMIALMSMQFMSKPVRVASWWILPPLGLGTHILFVAEPAWKGMLIELVYLVAMAAFFSMAAKNAT